MKKSVSNYRRGRQGFTLVEVALSVVLGSALLATTAYTANSMRRAVGGVFDETLLQTVARDVQLNLDKSLNAVNKDGVPDNITVSTTGMTMGAVQVRWQSAETKSANGSSTPGGDLDYSTDNGATWSSMADVGSRGEFALTEFAYGKFAPADEDDMPAADKTTYVLDERVRSQLLRVNSKLQKQDMVPMYMQQVRAPRAVSWSWVQTSTGGDPTKDTDGDGVTDDKDDFPTDPTRAFSERYPVKAGNTASVAFEDLYPSLGDADFNDLVSAFYIKETYGPGVKDDPVPANRPGLKEVYMRWYAQARGAGYNHAQRMYLGNLVKGGGKVTVFRYDPSGRLNSQDSFTVASSPYVDIFPDTKTQLPAGESFATNVIPGTSIQASWSTVVQVTFDDATQNRYGQTQAPPYDPYLFVKDTNQEIHLPLNNASGGTTGTLDSYKSSTGAISHMIDSKGNPWALLVPGNWAWPLETESISFAYPNYDAWVAAGRPAVSDWYLHPITDRYKSASFNTGGKAAVDGGGKYTSVHDYDANHNDRYVYVFDPNLFLNGSGAFLAPTASATTLPLVATPVPTATPSAGNSSLYPIALSKDALLGKNPGDALGDVLCGSGSGNFGWLSWAGSTSAPTLATSLTVPGDSNTYVNPNDATDHVINVGDWIQGSTGTKNSSAVRAALNTLESYDIVVPVYDSATGSGANANYHTYAFAKIHITDYLLPGQARITATYKGLVSPAGVPSTAPTTAPSATATPVAGAATATPAAATPTPSSSATATPVATAAPSKILPFAFGAALLNGLPSAPPAGSNYTAPSVTAGTSTSNFLWTTWTGDASEATWQNSMIFPGNSNTYVNPANSADHTLSLGDRVVAFTSLSNASANRTALDNLIGKTLVVPIFSSVSGGQASISNFVKINIGGYNLSGTDTITNVKYLGVCDAYGN